MKSTLFKTLVSLLVAVVILYASGVAPAAYNLIMDEAGALARRSTVNFTGAGVTCADDAGNNRTNCTIPGTSAGVPTCATYSVASTNPAFIVANTGATVVLAVLPINTIITGVDVKHSVQYSDGAGAMTDVNVSVGSAGGGATFYTAVQSIGEATAVADTTLQDTSLFKRYTSASENLDAVFTATGRNFGTGAATFLTGGSVEIGVCSVVKP